MQSKNVLGWLVAAVLLGAFAGLGFQDASQKTGVVDITKVIESSEFGKSSQGEFQARKASREGLLKFVSENRLLTVENATRLRDISVKPQPTEPEKAEAERIKAEAIAAEKKSRELVGKATPTQEDRTLMEEYARRAATMEETANRWLNEFTQELQQWADERKIESLRRARLAINDAAKKGAYTLIFEVGIAPYGVNDITDEALKSMNAQAP